MTDIITIGSATMDVFVESNAANIVSVCTKDRKSEFMSYPYGAKIDIDDFSSNVGGGGVNTAVNFAGLGFNTSAIFKIGNDVYADGILKSFEDKKVNLENIIQDFQGSTGFSIILTSFQGDRTVLAHRGTNAHLRKEDINWDAIKKAKFLYLAPLNGESSELFEPLMDFAEANDIWTCFNAGSTSLRKGFDYLTNVLKTAEVVVMNKEEASMATHIPIRPDTRDNNYSSEIIHPDVKTMLGKLRMNNPQIVVLTDGKHGAFAYDGTKYYCCPIFDGPVVSTLGAGDAFASTFCASMFRTKGDIGKSLMYGSVNSAAAVSKFGATEGLLTFEEIEKKLEENSSYTYKICG